MASKIRVTVWGENLHEQTQEEVREIYPDGMHACIAAGLNESTEFEAQFATFQQPQHGMTDEVLARTDVLLWWGHKRHAEVSDEVVEKIVQRVWQGMGLVILHSGHYSKIFKRLMGTACSLNWRVSANERERVWACLPGHPIAQGLGRFLDIGASEMYGEPFAIPAPDEQVFISWFSGGEVFRSGCTWRRGAGRIFYFSPGHETYPIYWNPGVRLVLKNAVRWAKPEGAPWVEPGCRVEPPPPFQ